MATSAVIPLTKIARDQSPLAIRYQFEKGPIFCGGHLEKILHHLLGVARNQSWLLPDLPIAKTSNIRGGELNLPGLPPELTLRLRAIERGNEVLLRHTYDGQGRMVRSDYVDGSIRYAWNARGQLTELLLPNGGPIRWRYADDGSLLSVDYFEGSSFAFEYDSEGRLVRRTYPDGSSTTFSYDASSRLSATQSGATVFRYDSSSNREFPGWTLHHMGQSFLPKWSEKKIVLPWSHIEIEGTRSRSVSALGIWTFENGYPVEAFLPDGDRRRLAMSDRTASEWTVIGQTSYQFGRDGALVAILWADGTRTVVRSAGKNDQALFVSQHGVTVRRDIPWRRSVTLRHDNGDYIIFHIDRGKRITRVSDVNDRWNIFYDRSAKLKEIRSSRGSCMRLTYGQYGQPQEVVISGAGNEPALACLNLVRLLWRVSVWQRTLLTSSCVVKGA